MFSHPWPSGRQAWHSAVRSPSWSSQSSASAGPPTAGSTLSSPPWWIVVTITHPNVTKFKKQRYKTVSISRYKWEVFPVTYSWQLLPGVSGVWECAGSTQRSRRSQTAWCSRSGKPGRLRFVQRKQIWHFKSLYKSWSLLKMLNNCLHNTASRNSWILVFQYANILLLPNKGFSTWT